VIVSSAGVANVVPAGPRAQAVPNPLAVEGRGLDDEEAMVMTTGPGRAPAGTTRTSDPSEELIVPPEGPMVWLCW
jgi:hypothetical protein